MRYVRADAQALALSAARAHAVPAVHQDDPEPVGALGGGEGGDERPQQLGASAAGRALDQQVRALGGKVDGDRAARSGTQHAVRASAQGPGVVGRVRPTGHQGRRGGPRQAQLVQEPGGPGQRCGHARVPLAAGLVGAQRGQGAREPLRPGEGDGVHRTERAVADGAAAAVRGGLGAGHAQQPQGRRHVAAEQRHRAALPEDRGDRAGRLVRLGHRGRRGGGGRLGEAHDVDAGPRSLHGQPRHRVAHVGTAGVAVHHDHRVRPREAAGRVGPVVRPRPGGPPGGARADACAGVRAGAGVPRVVPGARGLGGDGGRRRGGRSRAAVAGVREVVLQAAQQFVGAGRGLLAVVGEEQAAVLAVGRARLRQPAEPGPLRGPLLQRTGAVRADQDDLQDVRGVQGGELGHHRAGQPGQPRAGAGQSERPDLAQPGGHRHRGQRRVAAGRHPVGRAEPHRERLRVARPALPQPGPRSERRQQQGRGVRPGLGRDRRAGGRGRRRDGHRAALVRVGGEDLGVLGPAAPGGQPPCPRAEPAPPAHALGNVGAAQRRALASRTAVRAAGGTGGPRLGEGGAGSVRGEGARAGGVRAVGARCGEAGAGCAPAAGGGGGRVRAERARPVRRSAGCVGAGCARSEPATVHPARREGRPGAARHGAGAVALDARCAALAGHLCGAVRDRAGPGARRAVGVVGRPGGSLAPVGAGPAGGAVRRAGRARVAGRPGGAVRGAGAGAGAVCRAARRVRVRRVPRAGAPRPRRVPGAARGGGRVRPGGCGAVVAGRAVARAPGEAALGGAAGRRAGPVPGTARRSVRARGLASGPVPGRGRTRQPDVPLAVRRRGQPHLGRGAGRRQAQRRLADPQQRARRQADRAVAHAGTVQRRAVGGAEVGDRDAAVGVDGDRAVHPGDVRVVERDVGVGGAAEPDLPAVQQVDAARVGAGDHVQLGRGAGRVGVRVGLAGGAQTEHGAVDQRRLAQGAALGVEPLRAGVEHHLAGARALAAGERRGQRGGDRGQGRAGRCGDQHVAARGAVPLRSRRAQRVYDGQPDLHRRQRSLRAGARTPGTEAVHHGPPPRTSPTATRARRPVLHASSHLPPTTCPPPAAK